MTVKRSGGIYMVECNKNEKVCGHRPSVEVLFQSVVKYVGNNAVGVVLTGMGNDGADGLVSMREAGARTIAQDEATSVVFGMPKVAFEREGTDKLVPLHKVASEVMSMLSEKN